MNIMYDIAVVVATYNPVWEKLKATLLSILEQEDICIQIIVADDGSKITLFDKIEALFKEYEYTDYKLVNSPKNEGTVCNFYRGISFANAEYIKVISPGDLLFDTRTLSEWLKFTESQDADLTFCNMIFYNIKNNNIKIIRHKQHPKNISVYLSDSPFETKLINYFILEDKIYGASVLVKKAVFKYYLEFLLHKIVYTEDYFIRLAVFDNRKIVFFPKPGIWYEYAAGGISTTGEAVWKKRLGKDSMEMDRISIDYKEDLNRKYRKWFDTHNKYKRKWYSSSLSPIDKLRYYFGHPKWLYWKYYQTMHCAYSPVNIDDSFLQHCFGMTQGICQ